VLGIVTVGFVVGIGLVLASSRLLASRLYGVDPLDPLTIGAAMAVLAGAALLAAWMPVRRATRVDPMESLRAE
jgi:ABC-type antimicrobial peptide transport system permease subunit